MGMQGAVPDDVERFVRGLVRRLATVRPGMLVAVYLHGSAVLGDFQSAASDIDILVVVQDHIPDGSVQAMARTLSGVILCPGTGVEASVVEESAANRPLSPWPYLVHMNSSTAGGRCRRASQAPATPI